MSDTRTGTGGAGTGTGHVDGDGSTAPRSRQSAAKVRRAIVRVLAPNREMTPDEVQKAVATVLGTAERASIKAQLRVLRDGDYISSVPSDARKVVLTDSGRRWSRGISALSTTHRD